MRLAIIIIIFTVACSLAKAQSNSIKIDTTNIGAEMPYNDDDFTPPDFPGGLKKFYVYLSKNIHYPPNVVKNRIQGKVYLNFSIEKDGSIGDIKVVKGISKDLDTE